MRRRTLDVVLSTGGLVIAVALVILGAVFYRDARFARTYVSDQLAEQQITFKAADTLTEEEAAKECLVANAGEPLTTGKQAECYANDFIGLHLEGIADGMTYSQLGTPQRELRAQVAEAQETGDPKLPQLEAELAAISADRTTVFQGETLRGLLLTTYGFSVFGEKAMQAAMVLFVIAGIMFLLSLAGYVHAFATPRSTKVGLDLVGEHEHPIPAHRHVKRAHAKR